MVLWEDKKATVPGRSRAWPLAKQGHISSSRDLSVCMGARKVWKSLISPQSKRMLQAEQLYPASWKPGLYKRDKRLGNITEVSPDRNMKCVS